MKTDKSNVVLIGTVLSGLSMSVGWGFRGDYGHEAGAMVPGRAIGSGNLPGVRQAGLVAALDNYGFLRCCRMGVRWANGNHIPENLFGIPAQWWFLMVGIMLSSMILISIFRHRRQDLPLAPSGNFGRGQLLFLAILWIAVVGAFTQAFPGMGGKGVFFVHVTFWITGGICSLIVLGLSDKPKTIPEIQIAASDQFWKPGVRYWVSWLLVPVLIMLLAYLTTASHDEPLPGSHLRFTKNVQQ